MAPSSRPTSRLSYSEVARFGQPPESRHSAPPSIHQTSPKSPTSSLEPRPPPLSATPSASSTYLGTPSEITLLSYKEFTGEARDRDRRAVLWRAARTQPNTPLLGMANESSISLPTDYEFRAELVDDGVGGAIARVPRFSTSILSKSPSLLSTGPSSPLSLPEGSGSPAVFASQTMLRSASLPIPNQLSYESFEAGLIAKERLAGSVELTGEAPPSKMSPAAKSIIPVKGFNSSSPLAPARDRFRSRSDSYILRPHYFGDADDDELQDESPSFEVEDLSLSFSAGEDDLFGPSLSPKSNGLDTIQLLGGIFGIVVDESEGETPGSPDQTAIRDSEKENYEPGRPIGAVKTPTRPERLGTTPAAHFPKPIPIVDDRSPLSYDAGWDISGKVVLSRGPIIAPPKEQDSVYVVNSSAILHPIPFHNFRCCIRSLFD
ncbi:hypothetical protein FRC00_007572 [Tulasnella sp. 408]|nr:hypothetical protein FRC00_007572 [Tulasnella sp. 408]